MTDRNRIAAFCAALLSIAAIGSAGTSPASAQGRGVHRDDARTCAQLGAPLGSRDHYRCMQEQQRRRDRAPLNAAEAQLRSAEAARHNLETVRRMRCERAAKQDRQNGVPRRYC